MERGGGEKNGLGIVDDDVKGWKEIGLPMVSSALSPAHTHKKEGEEGGIWGRNRGMGECAEEEGKEKSFFLKKSTHFLCIYTHLYFWGI
jgi:hypothetical protein